MKIKRIFASDMRQAIRKVRDELGPDAVILSSRNIDGGVEVVSAVDYDERVIQAAAAAEPRESSRPAAFADLLSGAQASARKPGQARDQVPRQKIDISIDDDVELTFAEPRQAVPAPTPEPVRADKPLPGIEWTQEPAIQEMRQELKVLRNLFENQLTMMEWQKMGQRQPVRATLLKQLTELGLGPDVCCKLADHIGDEPDLERAYNRALALLAKHTPVTDDDILDRGGIVAMVGPTGVGKTTTVAKLAARYALRHGRASVALVTTDNFRIGAQDQLKNFGRILGVPVHTVGSHQELEAVLGDLKDKRLVLIDTAGMSQRDMRLSEQFKTISKLTMPIRTYLVMSANTQLASLSESVRAFKSVNPVACILTKLDEATSLGGAVTAVLRHNLPIAYLGVGQRVPEDLQPARSDRLIEHARALAGKYRQETDDEMLALAFGGAANANN